MSYNHNEKGARERRCLIPSKVRFSLSFDSGPLSQSKPCPAQCSRLRCWHRTVHTIRHSFAIDKKTQTLALILTRHRPLDLEKKEANQGEKKFGLMMVRVGRIFERKLSG